MTDYTDREFPEAVKDLLHNRQMSQRELARALKKKGGPGLSALNYVLSGDVRPSKRMMESVAKAFNIDPEYFPEYRLAIARDELDPDAVGLDAALRVLRKSGL